MKVSKSLLLQQQYLDAWENYILSKESKNYPIWDYIVLTTSNDIQAKGYDEQIKERISFLPKRTKFLLVPDENNQRVGSGGSTLSVIKKIKELAGKLNELRILVIHSGGDSKRTPQYSALGKLFSPVPRVLPDGRSSTLFDELIISMSSVSTKLKEGMVLLCGDVLLLFNPLKIDLFLCDAACLTFKEYVETGKNHGVFVSGPNGYAKNSLQKKSVEELKKYGALDEKGNVNIDTGAIFFSSKYLEALYTLIDTKEKYFSLVNPKVRLSLYVDFIYPMAEESTFELFCKEKPEGDMCEELISARKLFWDTIRNFKLKIVKLSPSKFLHFGSIPEIMRLINSDIGDYKEIGWSNIINSCSENTSSYDSLISPGSTIGKNVYVESSYIHSKAKIGDNILLSYVEIEDETIPNNVILHALKQTNGKFVCRIFGIFDNPKEDKIFGKQLSSLKFGASGKLWDTLLFPECDTMKEAIGEALNVYNIANGEGNFERWQKLNKKALMNFDEVETFSMIEWSRKMKNLIQLGLIKKLINENKNVDNVKSLSMSNELTQYQKEWLDKTIIDCDFKTKIRLLYYIGTAINSNELKEKCYKEIKNAIIKETNKGFLENKNCKIVKTKVKILSSVRVNFGGGWSDTPPYCLENGGTVINASILIDNNKPIEVLIEKISENKIIFDSRDSNNHIEYTKIEQLQEIDGSFDPFSLQKTCLIACGIIPQTGGNLEEILKRIGGGFIIHSEVNGIPKGSCLGTCSIIAAACVKAVLEFFGISYIEDDIYLYVFQMEQIMTTCRGWQDQIGGMIPGIKLIKSSPGINQKIEIKKLNIPKETIEQLKKRFFLIYTGERRLSRNILKEVIGRYIGNIEENVRAINVIKNIAEEMAYALENGNLDLFASLLNVHWNYSKMIHPGTTNALIEKIFSVIDDLIDGKMICGAGGGGFLQIILKKNVTEDLVHQRLEEYFKNSDIDIWKCTIEF